MRRSYHVRRNTFTPILPQFSPVLARLEAVSGRLSEFRDVLRMRIRQIFLGQECWRERQTPLSEGLHPLSQTSLSDLNSYSVDLAHRLLSPKSTDGKKSYTVYDVLNAQCTLEPMICLYCGGSEVTYDQYIGDAYCAECGRWQLGEEHE